MRWVRRDFVLVAAWSVVAARQGGSAVPRIVVLLAVPHQLAAAVVVTWPRNGQPPPALRLLPRLGPRPQQQSHATVTRAAVMRSHLLLSLLLRMAQLCLSQQQQAMPRAHHSRRWAVRQVTMGCHS